MVAVAMFVDTSECASRNQKGKQLAAYLARAQQQNTKQAAEAAGIKAGDSPLVQEEKLKAMQDELERKIEEHRRQKGQ
jgi:hypothetical protein